MEDEQIDHLNELIDNLEIGRERMPSVVNNSYTANAESNGFNRTFVFDSGTNIEQVDDNEDEFDPRDDPNEPKPPNLASASRAALNAESDSKSAEGKEKLLLLLKEKRHNRPILLEKKVYPVALNEGMNGMKDLEFDIKKVINSSETKTAIQFPSTYVKLVDKLNGVVSPKEGIKSALSKSEKKGAPVVKLGNICKALVGKKNDFKNEQSLQTALQVLHDTGYILWYKNHQLLRNYVFLSPQWVVDMIKSILRHDMFSSEDTAVLERIKKPLDLNKKEFEFMKDELKHKAILDIRLLSHFPVWKDSGSDDQFQLLELMNHFDLMFELPYTKVRKKRNYRKYFIPFYLKASIGQRKQEEIQAQENNFDIDDVLYKAKKNATPVPQPSALFDRSYTTRSEISMVKHVSNNEDEDGPTHIQWRYEFPNYMPEGLFLRMLVRSNAFVLYNFDKPPTERLLKARAPGGVNVYLQEEKSQNDIAGAGALILTCTAQSEASTQNLWECFSLFAFEIEDILSLFEGVEASVYVTLVNPNIGKVIVPRENVEESQLKHHGKRINVIVRDEKIPVSHMVPPLYQLKKPGDANKAKKASMKRTGQIRLTSSKTSDKFNIPPKLVRTTTLAKIEYALNNMSMQIEESRDRTYRVSVLAREINDMINVILKQIWDLDIDGVYPGADVAINRLKLQHAPDEVKKNLTTFMSLIRNSHQYSTVKVNVSNVDIALAALRKLFENLKDVAYKTERAKHKHGGLVRFFTNDNLRTISRGSTATSISGI